MSGGRGLWRLAVLAAAALVMLAASAVAAAAEGSDVVVADGVTQPVFCYAEADRGSACTSGGVDTTSTAGNDRVAVDIIRPEGVGHGPQGAGDHRRAARTTAIRAWERVRAQGRQRCAPGVTTCFPLFYDNYFVPRGYAVVPWTCSGRPSRRVPGDGGPSERPRRRRRHRLAERPPPGYGQGRQPGRRELAQRQVGNDRQVVRRHARERVASPGVDGLATIVPISAITSWYDYSRSNGSGSQTRTTRRGSRAASTPSPRRSAATCGPGWTPRDADDTGNYNAFWQERDYSRRLAGQGVERPGERLRRAHDQRPQRQARPLLRLVAGPGRPRCAAQGVDRPVQPRGSLRLPAGRVGGHAAPLVRPLAPGRRDADHEGAGRRLRALSRDMGDVEDLAGPELVRHESLASAQRDARDVRDVDEAAALARSRRR